MLQEPLDGPAALPLFTGLSPEHAVHILARLAFALVLGAVIAYRPWRRLPGGRGPRVNAETAQAQTIIAVGGALMVVVIGDSLARAFGLVGLGTFIRFRTGIKDPRDVAILFMMIGVGMACGLGLVSTATVGTLFVCVLLALFDRFGPAHRHQLRVEVTSESPAELSSRFLAAFPGAKVVDLPSGVSSRKRVAFRICAGEEVDAAAILVRLEAAGAAGVRTVRVDEEP